MSIPADATPITVVTIAEVEIDGEREVYIEADGETALDVARILGLLELGKAALLEE